ncbi:probable 4-coumarate--CoA ligase 2 [Dermacentor silvarum]|uniref:probable 4-coumarate--CoA ligase 2 n=1 Tax=Dermacentor silvarum TaxID=543639 RepID=UPI0021014303|nr:probable 4-coumarate--CoA ligase 2 [Dermacentor silvarum]
MKATIKDGIVYSPHPKVDIPLCSVYTAMKEFITTSPDQLALVDEKLRLTRGEFFSRMRSYAAGFQAQGIRLGDRVCVHLDNSVENMVVLFSITFTGASVLLSNPVLNENELLFQVDHGDATHILTSPQHAAKVTAVKDKTKVKGLFIIGEPVPGFVSVSDFTELNEDDFKEVPIADPKQTTLAVFYSSGTTGDAKGMEISHYSLVANLYMTKVLVNYEPGDVLLAWYPITYASGFMFIPAAAYAGATCVIVHPGLTFDQFVYYVTKYNVTTVATVPVRLHYYLADMMRTGTKLPSVKKINMGGTVLTQTFANKVLEVFDGVRSLRNHYATSESCGLLCSPPSGEISSGNVGFPAPMVELKFIDMDTGEKVGPRQYGELYFRIPSVMKGYYKNPALVKEFMDEDGWCKSGDIMYYDEDGRVYFVDRVKDMIKCLDQQVSSMELECLLQSHPSVADAAVVGVAKTEYGDAPTAFVVLRDPTAASPEVAAKLKEHVACKTEKFKHLHGGLVFMDRLPRNTNGKVIKRQLKLLYDKSKVY